MYKSIFNSRIEELWRLFQATGELNPPGEKGLLRELFVRRVIESILPHQFGLGSGTIIDKWNRQSSQADLIVYDRRTMPPFLESGGHGIYPFDSVLRMIEVKSRLDKESIRQFKDAVHRIDPSNPNGLKMVGRGNLERGSSRYPLSGLFAYDSDVSDVRTLLCDYTFPSNVIVCVATKGVVATEAAHLPIFHDVISNTRIFMMMMLQELESTAASRKKYSLVEWM